MLGALVTLPGFFRPWKVFAGIDVESKTVSGTGFRERALDSLVDIGTPDGVKRDGLVALVHNGQILDVLESLDGDAGLYSACSPVGEIVPAVGTFVDGVGRVRIVRFDYLPRPGPGEIGQVAFLLRVLVAVDCIERCKNTGFLHVELDLGLDIYSKSRPRCENGFTVRNCIWWQSRSRYFAR